MLLNWIKTDNVEQLQAYLENYPSEERKTLINTPDENGDTLLHLAARFDACKIIPLLLAQGADPDLMNDRERTPLILAIKHVQLEAISLLIPCSNLYHYDDRGFTPLHWAAFKDVLAVAKQLLSMEGSDPDAKNPGNNGVTPFMLAAEKKNITMCFLLKQHGAELPRLCTLPKFEENALLTAKQILSIKIVVLYLEAKPVSDLADPLGRIPDPIIYTPQQNNNNENIPLDEHFMYEAMKRCAIQ